MARIKLKNLLIKLTKNKNLNMFTKHNNKTRSNQFKPRCHHSPLAGESQSQLVGDAKEGVNKKFHKIKYSIKSK